MVPTNYNTAIFEINLPLEHTHFVSRLVPETGVVFIQISGNITSTDRLGLLTTTLNWERRRFGYEPGNKV